MTATSEQELLLIGETWAPTTGRSRSATLDERYGRSGQPIAVAGRRGRNQIGRRSSRLR
jgi:hypothetical protein